MDDVLVRNRFEDTQCPFSQASTLPGSCYTSWQWYEQEVDKIFLKEWLCVGREEQIPNPGDYFRFDIVGEPLVIVRDQAGIIHAHTAVCRHRGTMLAKGKGTRRAFICPYHNWTYALSGELLATPGSPNPMEGADGFRREEYGLISHRLETWEGFLFVTFDRNTPPLLHWLGDLPERFKNYKLGQMRLAQQFEYDIGCNWKVYYENSMESYHVKAVHRKHVAGRNQPPAVYLEGDGPYLHLFNPRSLTAISGFPPIEGLSDTELGGSFHVLLQPNLQLILTPTYCVFRQFLPQGPEGLKLVHNWCFPEATLRRSDFAERVGREYHDRYMAVVQEDMDLVPRVQQGLRSRFCKPGRFADEEIHLHGFANYIIGKVSGS